MKVIGMATNQEFNKQRNHKRDAVDTHLFHARFGARWGGKFSTNNAQSNNANTLRIHTQRAGFLSSCIFNQTFCVLSCAVLAECASASFLRNRLAKMEKWSALVASLGAHFYLPISAARKATTPEKGVKARSTRNLLRKLWQKFITHCIAEGDSS